MERLQNRIVAVTGAAEGIGRAIALRCAAEGARLALIDFDAEALNRTAETVRASGALALAIAADVTEEAPVTDVFARIEAEHGRLDVLVNNVGGARNARLWEMSAADWDFTIRLNLRSAFLCTRAALGPMMRQRSGAIVCLSSGAREGTPWTAHDTGGAAYATAKAGIHGFIRDAVLELAGYGIRVNAVAPGPIETNRTRPVFERLNATSEYAPNRLVPLRRIGQPHEIADAVLYLASDESSYVNGVTLDVTGGR